MDEKQKDLVNTLRDYGVHQLTKIIYEVSRVYRKSIGESIEYEWSTAPKWEIEAIRNGVQYHVDNPGKTPEDSHNNWLKEKQDTGWVHGEVRDPEAKTHPCMVPYNELPKEQQVKDHLFIAVVSSFQ